MILSPIIRPGQIKSCVADLSIRLRSTYQSGNPLMVPVLDGAWSFTKELIKAGMTYPMAPVKVSSYDGTESRELKVSDMYLMPAVAGRQVVIIEDIIDTGQTVDYLMTRFLGMGAKSVDVCALLEKHRQHEYPIPVRFSGFHVPDRFVVGFGLDYNGDFRDLPGIYILEE